MITTLSQALQKPNSTKPTSSPPTALNLDPTLLDTKPDIAKASTPASSTP